MVEQEDRRVTDRLVLDQPEVIQNQKDLVGASGDVVNQHDSLRMVVLLNPAGPETTVSLLPDRMPASGCSIIRESSRWTFPASIGR